MVDGQVLDLTVHALDLAGEVLRRGQGLVQTLPLSGEGTTVPDLLLPLRPATPIVAQSMGAGQAGEVTGPVP